MSFDPRLLEGILVCPRSKSPLVREGEALVSVDPACRLRYEIKDGIPNMLMEEATEMSVDLWGKVMRRHGRSADGALLKVEAA